MVQALYENYRTVEGKLSILVTACVLLVISTFSIATSSGPDDPSHRILADLNFSRTLARDEGNFTAHAWPSDAYRGSSTFVYNKTIFGAIIMADHDEDHDLIMRFRGQMSSADSEVADDLFNARSQNAKKMVAQLPFPTVRWTPVFSGACPYKSNKRSAERGLLYAHYRIWADFVYFDPDVVEKSLAGIKDDIYENKESLYMKGTHVAAKNGSLYKHGSLYRDNNILVVLEDDADIAVTDLHQALHEELSNMNTDLLYLGWCVGRLAKPVPLCTHAYALTLEGARKVIEHLELCGGAVDEQLVMMVKNKWLTYRPAHNINYINKLNSNYSKRQQHDKTHGIFHMKHMGSFNGH